MKKVLLFLCLGILTLNAEYSKKVQLPHVAFDVVIDKDFGVMQRNCQWCHSFGYVTNQGKQSKKFWRDVVVKMRNVYKAPISAADEETATEYLFRNYGNGELK